MIADENIQSDAIYLRLYSISNFPNRKPWYGNLKCTPQSYRVNLQINNLLPNVSVMTVFYG